MNTKLTNMATGKDKHHIQWKLQEGRLGYDELVKLCRHKKAYMYDKTADNHELIKR